MDLVSIAPWESQATTGYALSQVDGRPQVLWFYDQDADFGTKMMTLFMDMDTMLGPDFEQGLTSLTALGEQAKTDRVAAEQAAVEQAKADAAVAETEGDAPTETR
jgi:hypothetical protein